MDRISEKEKVRIAESLAEGAPAWRMHQEVHRSRHAIHRVIKALQRPKRPEPTRSPPCGCRSSSARRSREDSLPGSRCVGSPGT